MNNFFVNKITGFKLIAITFLLFSGCNVSLGQQIKVAEDENQYFEDIYLGVQLRGLSTKYQYFIDQNEKLVKSGYFKAQMEYVDTYGGASLKTLYRISGNYNNGKKEGKWIYEVIGYGLTLNFSKFNSDKWEYDHYKIDNSNEIASLYTATVEFKDDNPSGKATAKFKEKGQIAFSVECTMNKNFIFGKFSGKGKDFDITGEFDNLGRIHGEWIIQKKGVNFIGDSYENIKQYNDLTVKKYYTQGVLNEYKVYTVNGELLEKCKNKLAEYLEKNTIDAKILKIDTFYVLNADNASQDPVCIRTDKADVLDSYSNYSENEPYYKIYRNCSKYSKNSKFELNLYVYNGRGIGFLYEAEKIYNSKTREILLTSIKSSENYKDLEEFLSTFSFFNKRNTESSNCGLTKLVDLSKTSQNKYFFSRMYNFNQSISKVKTNNAILKVYENLDDLQNKICASNIYSKNNTLLGSNDIGEFLTGNTNKHEYFNIEFNKLGGKCWNSLIKLDNTISAISKNLDTYIDIPHSTGNSSMNPKYFTSNLKQAILDSFYSSAIEDIKDQNSIEELSQSLDKTNNKLTESFIRLEIRNKALGVVSKIEAQEKENARLELERIEKEKIANLQAQKNKKISTLENEKIEKERIEKERLEKERLAEQERQRFERERIQMERQKVINSAMTFNKTMENSERNITNSIAGSFTICYDKTVYEKLKSSDIYLLNVYANGNHIRKHDVESFALEIPQCGNLKSINHRFSTFNQSKIMRIEVKDQNQKLLTNFNLNIFPEKCLMVKLNYSKENSNYSLESKDAENEKLKEDREEVIKFNNNKKEFDRLINSFSVGAVMIWYNSEISKKMESSGSKYLNIFANGNLVRKHLVENFSVQLPECGSEKAININFDANLINNKTIKFEVKDENQKLITTFSVNPEPKKCVVHELKF